MLRGNTDPLTRTLNWPDSRVVYLTLDFECDFGTAKAENTYEAVGQVDQFVTVIEEHGFPVTCFVQTELLDRRPEAVERLQDASVPVSFHPHSHTHSRRSEKSIPNEIKHSTERYRDFFGSNPIGYRFPDGDVRPGDYAMLADCGYEFDASVFPGWRPGRFNHLNTPNRPQYVPEADIYEIPFTVYRRLIPIPTATSYCQFFGPGYTELLSRWPPKVVVLNVHMHDLVTPSTVAALPRRYRLWYERGNDGLGILKKVSTRLEEAGYSFDHIDGVHAQLRTRMGSG